MFGKKKISIDFLEPAYQLMTNTAKKENASNSMIINTLVDLFLRLSPDVMQDVGTYCRKRYQEEIISAATLTGFSQQQKLIAADQYRKISKFFGVNELTTDTQKNAEMKKVYLKSGYVIFPADWIILSDICGNPDTCMYAGVVESRNSDLYHIPHFIFFSDYKYGCDYPADLQDKIYAQCASIYPDFRRLYNLQRPIPDTNRTDPEGLKLMQDWKNAPEFGLFNIAEKGDPLYWNQNNPDYDPPYGAMIIRDI